MVRKVWSEELKQIKAAIKSPAWRRAIHSHKQISQTFHRNEGKQRYSFPQSAFKVHAFSSICMWDVTVWRLIYLPQFFTFEQYKKLLAWTPLSPGVVSIQGARKHVSRTNVTAHLPQPRAGKTGRMPRKSFPARWSLSAYSQHRCFIYKYRWCRRASGSLSLP